MFGVVRVLEDARPVYLLFEDKEQAQSFVDFTHLYIQESGAGNCYGAYWHSSDEAIVGTDAPIPTSQSFLKRDLIESMTRSVWRKRLALPDIQLRDKENEYQSCLPQFGVSEGAITFSFDKNNFPPRLQPNTEDLVTIVDNPDFDRVIARVRKIKNGVVALKKCAYSQLEEDIQLPLTNVMKIYDFLDGE